MSIYDYSYTNMKGETIRLMDYYGKPFMIVNTASECGFTPQYAGLEKLYMTFKGEGFTIIGFPCNQFGSQEPGTSEEIQNFCQTRYGVTFPLSKKVNVREPDIDPLFKFLTDKCPFKGLNEPALQELLENKFHIKFNDNSIKWNFTKFLVSKHGEKIQRFEPPVTPEALIPEIEALIGK